MTTFPELQTASQSAVCACVEIATDGSTRAARKRCVRCLGHGVKDPSREKTLARNLNRRIPTVEEQTAFTGAHCRVLWSGLPGLWRCPSCARSKTELLRWTLLFPNRPNPAYGWAGGLHNHHDHSEHRRFEHTVICEQCNQADGAAKCKLRLPREFSFAPAEIGEFIVATAHGWHLINYESARRIYGAAAPASLPLPPMFFGPAGGER